MSSVPVEYLGRARAFRAGLLADHTRAVDMMTRIALPLYGRFDRQAPSPRAFAKVAAAWRALPGAGRLALAAKAGKATLEIDEVRAGPADFRFDAWEEGERDAALMIVRVKLLVCRERFRFDTTPVAVVLLHALARRFQRGWDNSDAALRADLLALGCPDPELLAKGGPFDVLTPDGGRFAGVVVDVPLTDGDEALLGVRTYLPGEGRELVP